MNNFEDKCVEYWNQRQYKQSVIWETKTNTGYFQLDTRSYQYRIFTAATEADLHHQECVHHVLYQALHIIPPDDTDAELPISPSDKEVEKK